MAVPFDPFSLEILPPIRPDTPKANLFVAGMLLNRISYHFVETAGFARTKFMDPALNFPEKIDKKLEDISRKIEALRQIDPKIQNGLIKLQTAFLKLKEKCLWLRKERKKYDKLLSTRELPKCSEYQLQGGKGYRLFVAGAEISNLCGILVANMDQGPFRAGYIVDRFTHGTGNWNREEESGDWVNEDYCYSHFPTIPSGRGRSFEIAWRQLDGEQPCLWDDHVGDEDKVFLKWFRFDGISHCAPFLGNLDREVLSPTEWANAVTGMWDALVRWDKPSAGFERLSVSNGDVSLDGVVVVSLPPGGQLYQALKYMVDRLKDDPWATFSNEEIKAVVDSDDDSFSISKLIAPSKAGKNHRKLAEIIRPKVVVGDDGRDTVTLEKPLELKAFWQSADPEIDRVLRPSQRKSS